MEQVLFFLFVNGKGYGTLIQKTLKLPLTPIQKTLQNLENQGVILSHLEGKLRVYRWDPAFPLFSELLQLLRKAFMLLEPDMQRRFYAVHTGEYFSKESSKILLNFWKQLERVAAFTTTTHSHTIQESWSRRGSGEVKVEKKDRILIFHEKGAWEEDSIVNFSNAYRWTLDLKRSIISLEHLRQGIKSPVPLLDFHPASPHLLSSKESHFCGADIYFGKVMAEKDKLWLKWRVIGPKKNLEINCKYGS